MSPARKSNSAKARLKRDAEAPPEAEDGGQQDDQVAPVRDHIPEDDHGNQVPDEPVRPLPEEPEPETAYHFPKIGNVYRRDNAKDGWVRIEDDEFVADWKVAARADRDRVWTQPIAFLDELANEARIDRSERPL